MILTGMGPVDPMKDTPSKLFASAYALFSGVVFLSAVAIVLSPVLHRIVHSFHINEGDHSPCGTYRASAIPTMKKITLERSLAKKSAAPPTSS